MKNEIDRLNLVVGKQCWGFVAGYPNASNIYLHLGNKIERKKIINNKNLLFNIDKYIGEFIIGIFCTWRLQKENAPITSSSEPNNINGPLFKGLKKIIGSEITSIKLLNNCGDVEIYFDKICLKIFCDFTGHEDQDYYYQDELNWQIIKSNKNLFEVQRGCKINLKEEDR